MGEAGCVPGDPLGAKYAVLRDRTCGGKPDRTFPRNLWCLSREPTIAERVVHFTGQLHVDLDVHLVSPSKLNIDKDRYSWK